MSKMEVVEIWKQPTRIEVIQLFNVIIPTTRVEIVVAPNTNVIRSGVLMGFVMNLGCRSRRVSVKRNLNTSLKIPIIITGVVGTPHMVFTNMILTTHVNRIAYQPPMNSIAIGGYKN